MQNSRGWIGETSEGLGRNVQRGPADSHRPASVAGSRARSAGLVQAPGAQHETQLERGQHQPAERRVHPAAQHASRTPSGPGARGRVRRHQVLTRAGVTPAARDATAFARNYERCPSGWFVAGFRASLRAAFVQHGFSHGVSVKAILSVGNRFPESCDALLTACRRRQCPLH